MLRAFILLCFVPLFTCGAVSLSGEERVDLVLGEPCFARDATSAVSITEHSSLRWFAHEAEGHPAFGYTDDAIWMQVTITNPSEQVLDVAAELSVARLSEVSWYLLDGTTVEVSDSDGLMRSPGNQPEFRCPVFFFLLPAGESRTLFLRVASDSSIYFPVTVLPIRRYLRYSSLRDFRDYALAGAGSTILLLALVCGWILRSRLFGLLAILVAGFLGYYLIFNGYYDWLGGSFGGFVNRQFMLVLAFIGHWAFYAFTLAYVRRHGSPAFWCGRWGRVFSCALGCLGALLLLLPFRLSVYVFTGAIGVCYAASAVIGWHLVQRRKYRSDAYVAGTWGIVFCVIVLLLLNFYGVVPVVIPTIQLLRLLMLFIFVMFFAIVMVQQQTRQWEKERIQQTEQLATEAQLNALRYQLNPHFLFNTLTSIEALSRNSPEMIAPLVRRLAAFLRLRIHPSADGMTTLGQEWESICAYLDIEKVRFREKLQLTCEIGADAHLCRVPEMILQPLVENAIKHGMQTSEELTVCVCACARAGQLQIRVANSGKLAADSAGRKSGIGVANVRQRLAWMYGDAARFDLREEQEMVIAEIFIPAEEVDA